MKLFFFLKLSKTLTEMNTIDKIASMIDEIAVKIDDIASFQAENKAHSC